MPWLKELTPLTHTTVIHLRLDYLLHALMLVPLAPLWRLGFPRHPLRLIIPAGLALAVGLEGVQYLLPYRAWNVNDAIGNGRGFCFRRSFWPCEDLRGFENLAGLGAKMPSVTCHLSSRWQPGLASGRGIHPPAFLLQMKWAGYS